MNKLTLLCSGLFLFFHGAAYGAEDVATTVEGTVKKVDSATKAAVVRTEDGTEHTYRFVSRTAVHGANETSKGAKDAFHGLKEGDHVVVHATVKGAEETANEVDRIGEGGLKVTEGAVTRFDRGAKTVGVKTATGAEETYHMGDRAARNAGKDIAEGAEKSGKLTLYYTEEGGRKVAHFFKKAGS